MQIQQTTYVGVPFARGLGWVEFDFGPSAVSPIRLRMMGIWQKRLGSWAGWWNTQIKVNPTQIHEQMGRPIYCMLHKEIEKNILNLTEKILTFFTTAL